MRYSILLLGSRGFLSPSYSWAMFPPRSRHMYLLGILYFFGFDTATQIGLLGIFQAPEALKGLSFVSILVLPVIFAAGFSLIGGMHKINARRVWMGVHQTHSEAILQHDDYLHPPHGRARVGGIEASGLLVDHYHLQSSF